MVVAAILLVAASAAAAYCFANDRPILGTVNIATAIVSYVNLLHLLP